MTIKKDQTLTSMIATTMREGIVRGEIVPGTKLSEPKLAEQFQTSRGPIREAIRRLEMMGLVNHVAHEGVRVTTLSVAEVVDIYHVREALEGKAAGLAARNMTDQELQELASLMEVHREHQSHTGAYMQSDGDFDFHYKIIQGSKNAYLINELCEELYHLIRMFRYRSARFQHRAGIAITEHEQLLYALQQRDEQLAETMMRRHIAKARDDIASQISEVSAS